jgi:hypothetical protein
LEQPFGQWRLAATLDVSGPAANDLDIARGFTADAVTLGGETPHRGADEAGGTLEPGLTRGD